MEEGPRPGRARHHTEAAGGASIPAPEARREPERDSMSDSPESRKDAGGRNCLNCCAALAGRFCHECGQEDEDRRIPFRKLVSEAFGEVLSFDSRFFRSIRPLLLRPGFLTQEYMAGRRVRYLPPFRFYLIVSVVFFAALALNQSRLIQVGASDLSAPVIIGIRPDSTTTAALDTLTAGSESTTGAAPDTLAGLPGFLARTLAKASADEDRLNREIRSALPRLMFLLMPLFALMLWLLHIRTRRLYIEHLVFALHLHTFAFLLLAVALLAGRMIGPRVGGALQGLAFLMVVAYLFRAMRRVYAQSVLKTLGKLVGLWLGYLLIFAAAVVVAVGVTVAFW